MIDVGVKSEAKSSKPAPRAHSVTKPKPKSGLGHLVGYLPNRGDFETEWENDAELTLADMEFKEEDTQWEKDLKLKVLEIYNSKLDARIERKKFILERGLLERKEKKRSKEEREVYNNMRVFARFHSAEEHEAFIQGLLSQEHTARTARKTHAPRLNPSHDSHLFVFPLSLFSSLLLPVPSDEQRLRKKIEQLQMYRLNGIRTLADGELFEIERRKREGAATAGKKTAAWETPGSGAGTSKGKKRVAESASASSGGAAGAGEEDRSGKKSKGADGKSVVPANPEWDVSKMPGHELLSSQERLLCATLQLLPQHYLMIKERLIRECFTRGFLKENSAKQLIKIDVNKTSKIFDFFVSVGWLNTGDVIKATQGNAAAAASNANVAPNATAGKKPTAAAATSANATTAGAPRAAGNYPPGAPAVKIQQ